MMLKEFIKLGNAGEIKAVTILEKPGTGCGLSIVAETEESSFEPLRTQRGHVRVFSTFPTLMQLLKSANIKTATLGVINYAE